MSLISREDSDSIGNNPAGIAQSLIPYNYDDNKARYLGYRASGFTIREALKLIGVAHSTLSFWRLQPEFVEIEERLPEIRQKLAAEYVGLEFVRNYRLVLEKDMQVLRNSVKKDEDGKAEQLTKQEQEYLIKLRGHYTPQQLEVLQTLLSPDKKSDASSLDFTQFVITARRTKVTEEMRITTGKSDVNEIVVESDNA